MSNSCVGDKITILLTGATGYLGSSILKSLLRRNDCYKIIILKRSFSNCFRIDNYLDQVVYYDIDRVDIRKVFIENKIDIILHCATDYGRKNISSLQIIEANLILPIKLIEIGNEYGVKCFINTDTILDKRINHYSLSKKQFKDWLLSYDSSLICVNVVSEHFYGPGDDKTKFVSYVIDKLLNKVEKIDLTLGEQKRDFIYIDDMVDAFVRIIDYSLSLDKGFYEFQTGSERATNIKDLVLMISDIINNHLTILNFGALSYRENEIMECTADVAELKKLGWSPQYTLFEGLQKTIEAELLFKSLNN